jgi:hypothetical protein
MFELEEFWIYEGDGGKSVLCEVDLVMTERAEAATMPSMNDPGDPGWPAVFEIHEVRLIDVSLINTTLTLSETEFATFFHMGPDVMNNAYEWAAEQEIERE